MTKANHSDAHGKGDYPATLIVGDLDRWTRTGRALPTLDGLTYISFADLVVDTITRLNPDIVMSPLMTRSFDAVDIARILAAALYTGRYRAVNDALPNADLIIAEVAEVAPYLDFAVLTL